MEYKTLNLKIMTRKTIKTSLVILGLLFSAQELSAKVEINNFPGISTNLKVNDENPTAKTVIENYLKAIGGRDKVEKVTSITTKQSLDQSGIILDLQKTYTKDAKYIIVLSYEGQEQAKDVYDGAKGYSIKLGVQEVYDEKTLASKKLNAFVFPETNYKENLKVTSETFQGEDCFVLDLGGQKNYYSKKTELKIAVEKIGKIGTSITAYSDYRNVDGILVPFKETVKKSNGEVEMITNSVEFNKATTQDFQ